VGPGGTSNRRKPRDMRRNFSTRTERLLTEASKSTMKRSLRTISKLGRGVRKKKVAGAFSGYLSDRRKKIIAKIPSFGVHFRGEKGGKMNCKRLPSLIYGPGSAGRGRRRESA